MDIAFVARTKGLEYDDRIRKECITLLKKNSVFIYVNFEDNREESGVTSYGVPYKSIRLITRDKLPSSKYLLIKSYEFYWRIRKHLRKYDLIWSHEEYTFMFPLFARRNRCIWDLHEIPFRFEGKSMRKIFNFIERKSKKILHANPYRIEYLRKEGVIKHPLKHDYIRNLPDRRFMESNQEPENFDEFKKWVKSSDYVYLQGLTVPRRHPLNTVEAVMAREGLKAVVVGNFDKEAKKKLEEKYGKNMEDKIFFAGLVNQLGIPSYLKHAKFSIILYDVKTPNNRYCEPNRLYQSIVMNVPVIVGKNEPMKEIVETGNYGEVLKSDGGDLDEISEKIEIIMANFDTYKSKNKKTSQLIWDDTSIKESWYA